MKLENMKRVVIGMLAVGLGCAVSELNSAEAASVLGGKIIKVGGPEKAATPRKTIAPRKTEAPEIDEFRVKADGKPYFSPNIAPYWVSYRRWTAYWWQWAVSAPLPHNPVADKTGKDCGVNQHGPVWFLAGSFETTPVKRTCNVPQDKAILVPIVNLSSDNTISIVGDSESMRASIKPVMDGATNLVLELDGRPVPNIKEKFRFKSPIYSNSLPPENIFELFGLTVAPGVIHPSVADGYFVMLKPLSPGTHTLVIKGEVPSQGFVQDISYKLNVCKLQDVVPLVPDPRSCP